MKQILIIIPFLAVMGLLPRKVAAQSAEKSKPNEKQKASGTATDAAFKKGSKTTGIAAGLGVNYDYYGSSKSYPALTITHDKAAIEDVGPGTIGFGWVFAAKYAYYNYENGYKAYWLNLIAGTRATYHITALKDVKNRFDPYVGVMVGARYFIYNDNYFSHLGYNPYSYNSVYLVTGVFAGAKYNLSRGFGVFAELGYDVSNFRVGINFNSNNQ